MSRTLAFETGGSTGAGGLSEEDVQALVDAAVADLLDGAPGALDTLNELAAALGDDANFAASMTTALAAKAADADVVHDTGDETVAGVKTFTSDPIIPDEAYDATGWNGSLEPPTKNAVRDKIETLGGPKFKQTWLKHSANLTTSSTSYVDIDGTLLPALSLTLAVGDVVDLELYIGSMNMANSGNVAKFDWLIDRPTSADTTIRAIMGSDAAGVFMGVGFDTYKNAVTIRASFVCTEAGVHTFKPQWMVGGSTAQIIFSDANYDAPARHRITNLGAVAA